MNKQDWERSDAPTIKGLKLFSRCGTCKQAGDQSNEALPSLEELVKCKKLLQLAFGEVADEKE